MRQQRRTLIALLGLAALVAAAAASATGGDRIAYVQEDGGYQIRAANPAGSPVVTDLTNDPSPSRHAVGSPDGSRIAYMSTRDGSWQIYVANADGSNPVRVTSDLTRDALAPQWSPDGTRIVYYSRGLDDSEIRMVAADGTGKEATITSGGEDSFPDYSPDGTHIVFERTVGMNADIWVMQADGGNQLPIRATTNRSLYPVWSPDGNWIAFCSPGPNSQIDIWVMRPDGSDAHDITPDPYADADASWAPDSRSLLYTSYRNNGWTLYTVPLAGSPPTQLRQGPGDFPSEGRDGRLLFDTYKPISWQVCARTGSAGSCLGEGVEPALSPDGTRVAFENGAHLWIVPAGGGPTTRVRAAGLAFSPAWSPDGKSLAFVSPAGKRTLGIYTVALPKGKPRLVTTMKVAFIGDLDWGANGLIAFDAGPSEGQVDIWVVGANGKVAARKIPNGTPYDSGPAWSLDGTKLAYVSHRDTGLYEVYVQPWPSGAATAITNDRMEKGEPFWSPDGRRIGYTQQDSVWGDERLMSVPVAGGTPTPLLALSKPVFSGAWR